MPAYINSIFDFRAWDSLLGEADVSSMHKDDGVSVINMD